MGVCSLQAFQHTVILANADVRDVKSLNPSQSNTSSRCDSQVNLLIDYTYNFVWHVSCRELALDECHELVRVNAQRRSLTRILMILLIQGS